MLIFTRKNNESIRVTVAGETIWIKIFKIDRGRCKIGIDAPATAQILRGELLEASCEWIREASRQRGKETDANNS